MARTKRVRCSWSGCQGTIMEGDHDPVSLGRHALAHPEGHRRGCGVVIASRPNYGLYGPWCHNTAGDYPDRRCHLHTTSSLPPKRHRKCRSWTSLPGGCRIMCAKPKDHDGLHADGKVRWEPVGYVPPQRRFRWVTTFTGRGYVTMTQVAR